MRGNNLSHGLVHGVLKDFEKRFHFKYRDKIGFENEEERQDILERGMKLWRQGDVSLRALKLGRKYRLNIESGFFQNVQIKRINKRIGCGLYASENIPKGQFLGEYTGIVHKNDRRYCEPLNNYCYEYPVPDYIGRSYVIDAMEGNFARFINHSYCPNLKPEYAFFSGFFHLVFITLRDIEIGEQFFYNYGLNYWYIREQPCAIY